MTRLLVCFFLKIKETNPDDTVNLNMHNYSILGLQIALGIMFGKLMNSYLAIFLKTLLGLLGRLSWVLSSPLSKMPFSPTLPKQ